MNTPWGQSQTIKTLAEGIKIVTTASHGGIMVNDSVLHLIPDAFLVAAITLGNWYCFEEDCATGLVYESLPHLFRKHQQDCLDEWKVALSKQYIPDYVLESGPESVTSLEAKLALSDDDLLAPVIESNRYWYPEIFGLGSRCRNCDQLGCAGHADQWISVCAWGYWRKDVPKGMVGVSAILGGRTSDTALKGKQAFHLVPEEEYKNGFFVVDPARHARWETDLDTTSKEVSLQ